MKRTLAIAVLLAALTVLFKLAFKPAGMADAPTGKGLASSAAAHTGGDGPGSSETDPKAQLLAKYSSAKAQDRDLIARVAERFGRNAQSIEQTDGLRGLVLLDRLDIEAIFLYEKHPDEFRRLRDVLGGEAAADLLLHWREYFGLKRADDTDRNILIAEIARLTPAQQKVAARYPAMLPLFLADPRGVTGLIDRMKGDEQSLADALAILCFIDLEPGSDSLRSALQTLERHGDLALDAFRRQGPQGFALVRLYGPVLESLGDAVPLDQALILIRVNAAYIDELLRSHRPETVAGHIRHAAAAGLTESVGGSPDALRLIVEYGQSGEQASEASRARCGGRRLWRFRRRDVAAPGGPGAGGSRADGPGDARQVRRGPRFRADPSCSRRGRHPADRPGGRRSRDAGFSRGQEEAVAQRVARAGRAVRLGRQRAGDDPHDQERRPRASGRAGSDGRSLLSVPPLVRRDPPRQRAAARLRTDRGRDNLGTDRRLFRDHRRPEPGGHPARGGSRRRGDPRSR